MKLMRLIYIIIIVAIIGLFYNLNKDSYTIQDSCQYCNKIYGNTDNYYSVDDLSIILENCGEINSFTKGIHLYLDNNNWTVAFHKPNKITGKEDFIQKPLNKCLERLEK